MVSCVTVTCSTTNLKWWLFYCDPLSLRLSEHCIGFFFKIIIARSASKKQVIQIAAPVLSWILTLFLVVTCCSNPGTHFEVKLKWSAIGAPPHVQICIMPAVWIQAVQGGHLCFLFYFYSCSMFTDVHRLWPECIWWLFGDCSKINALDNCTQKLAWMYLGFNSTTVAL